MSETLPMTTTSSPSAIGLKAGLVAAVVPSMFLITPELLVPSSLSITF